MKKICLSFFIGLVVGIYVSHRGQVHTQQQNPIPSSPLESASQTQKAQPQTSTPKTTFSQPQRQTALPIEKAQAPVDSKNSIESNSVTKEIKNNPQFLNIHVSEEQIENIEQNLNELQKDVTLFKDTKGWIVRFHQNANLISSLGIHDNDLIRFEQFHELKKNPIQEPLISRLETIFSQLER